MDEANEQQQQQQQQQTEATAFYAWCIAELFGHKRTAGRVSEVVIAGVGMLKIEVPADEGDSFRAVDYYNPKAIYRMRPCSETEARAAAKVIRDVPPVHDYELRALTAGAGDLAEDDDDRDDEEW